MVKSLVVASILALVAGAAPGEKVQKAAWMDRMSTVLPTIVCKPESYFRQCFDVAAEECEELAASSTRVCLKKHAPRIPAVLTLPEDGREWGRVVGTCAGEAFEISVLKKKRATAKCNDPSAWR